MTGLVWANVPLAMFFILAFAGLPLWMTFKHPETAQDNSHARSYLATKAHTVGATAQTGSAGQRPGTRPPASAYTNGAMS